MELTSPRRVDWTHRRRITMTYSQYTKSLSGWRAVAFAVAMLTVLGVGALVIARDVAVPAAAGTLTAVANFFSPANAK
jgi:hypothetical protein